MASRSKPPVAGRTHARSLVLSVEALASLRLNLDGVRIQDGTVAFAVAEHCADFSRIAADKFLARRLERAIAAGRRAQRTRDRPWGHTDLRRFDQRLLLRGPAKRLGLSAKDLGLLRKLEEEVRGQEFEARAGKAIAVMRRTALLKRADRIFILSTHDPSRPQIVAQSSRSGVSASVAGALDKLYTVLEILWELFAGVLSVLGVSIKTNIPLGRILDKLADFLRRRPRLLEWVMKNLVGRGSQLSAMDLLQFFVHFLREASWDCLGDIMLEVVDLTFWGILRFLLGFSAKLSPGLGQTLLLADLALIVGELVRKILEQLA